FAPISPTHNSGEVPPQPFLRPGPARAMPSFPVGRLAARGKNCCTPRHKKRSRPEGRLPLSRVPVFSLEEDHAADLEEVEILEVRADSTSVGNETATANRASSVQTADPMVDFSVVADRIKIELKMLPVEEDMHGSRVDLLHDTSAPT